ncbi:MAG: tetratricopeptide repeat protein [Spirochaetes bacterium]|nr:tetratricopeptide repeat protein [Spirochaetota bacterium]
MKNRYRYSDSEDYYDMAFEWIKQKNPDKAEDCLKRAISLNPNFVFAYITLSALYAKSRKYHEAISILKNASKIDPCFDRLYYLMAKYSYKESDYKNSLKYMEQAIEYNPLVLYLRSREIIIKKYRSQRR